MNIKIVSVVGLGTLGTQLAIQAAVYGHEVHGFDPEAGNLRKMMAKVRAAMQMTRKGPTFPLEEWDAHAAKVHIHTDWPARSPARTW